MLFWIISAWFLCDMEFSIYRAIRVLVETAIAGIILLIVDTVLLFRTIGLGQTIKTLILYEAEQLLTPLWSENWYVTVYVISLLISPYLNWINHSLPKEQIKKLLLVFGFVPVLLNFQSAGLVRGGVMYFPYFYILIGYLKRYCKDNWFETHSILKFVVVATLYSLTKISYPILPKSGILGVAQMFLPSTLGNDRGFSFIVAIMSLLLFYIIKDYVFLNSKAINTLGKYTFAVYLFHGHSLPISRTIRWTHIWELILARIQTNNQFKLITAELIMVVTVYFISMAAGIVAEKLLVDPINL